MKKSYDELKKKERIYSAALITLIIIVAIAAFTLSYLIISQI